MLLGSNVLTCDGVCIKCAGAAFGYLQKVLCGLNSHTFGLCSSCLISDNRFNLVL